MPQSLPDTAVCGKRIYPVHFILLGIILLFSGYLIFKNLGAASLWIDESATAIIAKNFLKTGHFTGWDGRNLFSLRNGTSLTKELNDRNPPAQFILTALSFSLFGENNFSARVAMAIIGLLTVILLYWYLRKEFPERPAVALYGAAFLGIFPEYILYTRNCRYYAVVAFAALLTFFAYRQFIKRLDVKSAIGLATAAVIFYFSQYQICLAFLFSLCLAHLFFEQQQLPKKHWLKLLFVSLLFAAVIIPYSIIYRVWERPDLPAIQLPDRIAAIWCFLRDSIGTGIAPWFILASSVVLLVLRQYNGKVRSIVKQVLLIVVINILIIGFTSQQEIPDKYPIANLRYLVACFPFTAILAALILYQIHRKSRVFAFAVALILIGSNISYVFPGQNQRYKFRHPPVYSPLYEYLKEIHHPYPTATSAVTEYLKSNAKQDDTYYCIPEYTNDPIKFYLGSRLINSCLLGRETRLGADRMKSLSPHLLIEENFPDWLVFFGRFKIKSEQNSLRYFSRTFNKPDAPGLPFNHDYALVKMIDKYWGQTNQPEIFLHNFGPVNRIIPNENIVMIYRKVKDDHDEWLLHFPLILYGARMWSEQGILIRALDKFYGMYVQDRTPVLAHYSKKEIVGYFKLYGKLLTDEKRFVDADKISRIVLQMESDKKGL
jgi:hypothetical protein